MAAAREGAVEFNADGSVTLAGVTSPDEVEIHATPRPGTVVAGDEGLVVVSTRLTPDLVAEGDARELQRAIRLRKDAGLELDDRIDLWVANAADDVAPYSPRSPRSRRQPHARLAGRSRPRPTPGSICRRPAEI
jgi:hypothetical protein